MHDFVRATLWASRAGRWTGFALIAAGIVMFLSHPFAGLWTAFIGWTLTQASQAGYAQSVQARLLEGAASASAT
jgi:hypothetical protein